LVAAGVAAGPDGHHLGLRIEPRYLLHAVDRPQALDVHAEFVVRVGYRVPRRSPASAATAAGLGDEDVGDDDDLLLQNFVAGGIEVGIDDPLRDPGPLELPLG